jgi:hypothetical protein
LRCSTAWSLNKLLGTTSALAKSESNENAANANNLRKLFLFRMRFYVFLELIYWYTIILFFCQILMYYILIFMYNGLLVCR